MLAGRGVQGAGAGVTFALVEVILSDLVPLKERGVYQGAFSVRRLSLPRLLALLTPSPLAGHLVRCVRCRPSARWRLCVVQLALALCVERAARDPVLRHHRRLYEAARPRGQLARQARQDGLVRCLCPTVDSGPRAHDALSLQDRKPHLYPVHLGPHPRHRLGRRDAPVALCARHRDDRVRRCRPRSVVRRRATLGQVRLASLRRLSRELLH